MPRVAMCRIHIQCPDSVHLGHVRLRVDGRAHIADARLLARGQIERLGQYILIGDLREQVMDAVEPRPLLHVALHHPPRRLPGVGVLEHLVLGAGELLPAIATIEVDLRELPALHRVVDAVLEAAVLLLVGYREPVLHQDDPATLDHALEVGAVTEELPHLLLGRPPHHTLDHGAVVPGTVEQHDLAGGRQLGDVALEVPLRGLAVGKTKIIGTDT